MQWQKHSAIVISGHVLPCLNPKKLCAGSGCEPIKSKQQIGPSLEGNQNAFENLTSFIHRPVHQMNGLFLKGMTLTGIILHYPTSIQHQIPCQSLQAVLFHISPIIWGLKCYLPLARKRVWMLSGLERVWKSFFLMIKSSQILYLNHCL